MNCHGCKWLDEVKRNGDGYCAVVVRSKNYKQGDRVRRSDMERCELFEAGAWKTRHEKAETEERK